MRALCTLVVGLSLAGCYRVHERGGEALVDAGADAWGATLRDAGPGGERDAYFVGDRGPILPPDPEPDGSVDVPPDAWRADGATPSGVVLEPVGDPIVIDDTTTEPGARGGSPTLAWNGAGWGAAWGGIAGLRLRLLDEDGVPIGASRELVPLEWPNTATLEFAIGRYAVIATDRGRSSLRFFDRAMRPASGPVEIAPAHHGDVARLEAAHQWLVASRSFEPPYDIVVSALDDDLREPSPRITLHQETRAGVEADGAVLVAALKTRAVVAWVTPTSVQAAVFTGAPLAQASPVFDIDPLAGVSDREDLPLRLRPIGAHIALAVPDGTNVVTFSIDPWTATRSGPSVVGPTGIIDRYAGIAPMPEHATYGVCWARGNGPAGGSSEMTDGISMRVFDEQGAPLSDVLPVVSGLRNIGGVDCGWNGTDFVILWWRAAGDNELYAQRVRPHFE